MGGETPLKGRAASPKPESFGRLYADYYDMIYSDKNYDGECDFLESIFRKLGQFAIRKVIDVSCGTGGHAIQLAKRGYVVEGFDLSEHMIRIARMNAKALHARLALEIGDMRHFRTSTENDASICMFDSIDFLLTNKEVECAFLNIARHLRRDGLFVCQFWNGHAVVREKPVPKEKFVYGRGLSLVRKVNPVLNSLNHTCGLTYDITVTKKESVIERFQERQLIRYFFPYEIRLMLERSGFSVVGFYPMADRFRSVTSKDWSIVVVALRR